MKGRDRKTDQLGSQDPKNSTVDSSIPVGELKKMAT